MYKGSLKQCLLEVGWTDVSITDVLGMSLALSGGLCQKICMLIHSKTPKLNILPCLSRNGQESTFVCNGNRRLGRVMAMVQGGTIGLWIESGRWRGEPRERRICQSCNSNEIEDTEHWLIRCSTLNLWRQSVFESLEYHVSEFRFLSDEDKQIFYSTWPARKLQSKDLL